MYSGDARDISYFLVWGYKTCNEQLHTLFISNSFKNSYYRLMSKSGYSIVQNILPIEIIKILQSPILQRLL